MLGELTYADDRMNPMERSGKHPYPGQSGNPNLNPGSDFDLGGVSAFGVLL